jgi:hypothetical protein
VARYAEFICIVAKKKRPGTRRAPPSIRFHRVLSLNARQSEEDPPHWMEMFKNLPQQSHTPWQLSQKKICLQKSFFLPRLQFAASSSVGFEIQIRILSIAPAQEEKPTVLALQKAEAICFCLSWSARYLMKNCF